MFNDTISTAFMILAVILAVVAGLWFGSVLGESAAGTDKASEGKPRKRRSFGSALQNAATTAAVRAWKWQRSRKKRKPDERGGPER